MFLNTNILLKRMWCGKILWWFPYRLLDQNIFIFIKSVQVFCEHWDWCTNLNSESLFLLLTPTLYLGSSHNHQPSHCFCEYQIWFHPTSSCVFCLPVQACPPFTMEVSALRIQLFIGLKSLCHDGNRIVLLTAADVETKEEIERATRRSM